MPRSKPQRLMKQFWNSKAREHAPFYIATWRGYDSKGTEDFFLAPQEAREFLAAGGYAPTGRERMLEIGCGIGRMTHGFAQIVGEIHALDVSGEMVRQGRRNLAAFPNAHLYETAGTDLGLFQDGSFDLCFSYIVFQHIPDPAITLSYIREMGRVLKPGGTAHFQVSGLPDGDAGTSAPVLALKRFYRAYVRRPALLRLAALRGGPGGFESPAWQGSSLSRAQVEAACAEGGMAVAKVTGENTAYMWVTARKG